MANQRKVVISSNEELAEELEVDEVSTISQEDIIDEAEEELKGMVLLMEQFKNEGHQAEFEEIDSHNINENSVASLTIKVAVHPFAPQIWPEK